MPLSAITFHKDSNGKVRKEPHHQKKERQLHHMMLHWRYWPRPFKYHTKQVDFVHFWTISSSEQTANTDQPMADAMHEGSTQKLTVFDGIDTALPPSAIG